MNLVEIGAARRAVVAPQQLAGLVCSVDNGHVVVDIDGQQRSARVARSCLIRPEPGDTVLLWCGEESWVLAILDGPHEGGRRLVCDGDFQIGSATGRLELRGELGVAISSPGSVELESSELKVRSRSASLAAESLEWLAARVEASVLQLSMVGKVFRSVFERVHQTSKVSTREVEQLEDVAVGQLHISASGSVVTKGKNLVSTAADVVKIDGKQIQLG